jgi:hypothetical protein
MKSEAGGGLLDFNRQQSSARLFTFLINLFKLISILRSFVKRRNIIERTLYGAMSDDLIENNRGVTFSNALLPPPPSPLLSITAPLVRCVLGA